MIPIRAKIRATPASVNATGKPASREIPAAKIVRETSGQTYWQSLIPGQETSLRKFM